LSWRNEVADAVACGGEFSCPRGDARRLPDADGGGLGSEMLWLYNILFTFAFYLVGPFYLWRIWRGGRQKESFGQRFGRYGARFKQAITNRQVIWLHVAGTNGVNACTQLIRAIELRAPTLTVVVSTSSPTCMTLLGNMLPSPKSIWVGWSVSWTWLLNT
jgi:hypothetical protein